MKVWIAFIKDTDDDKPHRFEFPNEEARAEFVCQIEDNYPNAKWMTWEEEK